VNWLSIRLLLSIRAVIAADFIANAFGWSLASIYLAQWFCQLDLPLFFI